MITSVLRAAVLCSVACVSILSPAAAQEAAPSEKSVGARVYLPEEFERFAPRTALDMLRQVPGFVIREQTEERGLGVASGNVVLNGQRASGKSEDVLTQLGRIPAKNVVRIEIVDGAALGIPGLSGQVANIVTEAGGVNGQFQWRPDFRARNTRPLLGRFNISANGEKGPVEFTIGLENQSSHSGADGPTYVYSPAGALIDLRNDEWTGEFDQPKGSLRLAIDGPGSSKGNLHASYRQFWYDYIETGTRQGAGLADRFREVTVEEDGHNYEIGGDFEFKLGPGRLKLIALDSFRESAPDSTAITSFADGSPSTGNRFRQESEQKEMILRSEYAWKTGKSDWQVTGEGAFNSLDTNALFFSLQPAGFVPVPLPGASARVEEDRYEAIASFGRPLSDNFSIKIAAGGEYSQLSQIGGGGVTRTFWRPKGQITAAWKASPRTDVNFRLQRKVGQLNFYDFLASVDLTNNLANAGNINLVPPQSWELEVETARSLGKWGSATLRLYGRRIDDIVDIVPIGATGESIGNLDQATVYGGELKGTIEFAPLGLKGAKLDATFQLQKSSVEDPLTGETREISDSLKNLVEASFRHDIPGTDVAWGLGTYHDEYAPNVRLTELGRQYEGPVWQSVFIEHKDVFGLTVRASASNLVGARSRWDRINYVDRRTGAVETIEDRDRAIGPIFTFQIGGKF